MRAPFYITLAMGCIASSALAARPVSSLSNYDLGVLYAACFTHRAFRVTPDTRAWEKGWGNCSLVYAESIRRGEAQAADEQRKKDITEAPLKREISGLTKGP